MIGSWLTFKSTVQGCTIQQLRSIRIGTTMWAPSPPPCNHTPLSSPYSPPAGATTWLEEEELPRRASSSMPTPPVHPPPYRYISKLANWRPHRCHHQSSIFSARQCTPKRNSTTEESASEFLRFAARDLFMRANKGKQSDEEISRVAGSRVFGTP